MPRGPKGEKRPADVFGNAGHVMRIALKGLSPAMAAGVSDTLWSMAGLAEMIDANLPKPGPRGSYKKARAALG
jgi:hypothetical protein